MTTTLQKGDRVRIVNDVENFPHIYLHAGECGVVTDLVEGKGERWLHVLLDRHHDELEEWQNVVQIYEDAELNGPEHAVETFVTVIPLTVADLAVMAKNGKPIDDEEWGGERQILAQNMVPIAMERAGFIWTDEHDSWCEKATVYEIMDKDVEWFHEWKVAEARAAIPEIAKLTNLDDACLALQNILNVKEGDLAAQVFSGIDLASWAYDMTVAERAALLSHYVDLEAAYPETGE